MLFVVVAGICVGEVALLRLELFVVCCLLLLLVVVLACCRWCLLLSSIVVRCLSFAR